MISSVISFAQVNENLVYVGGVLEFSYVEGNKYDFITGAPKSTTKTFLDFKLTAWNLVNRNTHMWGVMTNIPNSYNSKYIFYPRYEYDFGARPRPYGRGERSWISLYGSFDTHNPEDWKKSLYNWPYGFSSRNKTWVRAYSKLSDYIVLEAIEATWKYGSRSYSSFGSIENAIYRYTFSTTTDYYREIANASKGSIPGKNDPKQEFYIPNEFWNTNSYAHIAVLAQSIQDTDNTFMPVNFEDIGTRLGHFNSYDTFIFPYLENGVKKTLINDSPVIYYFGQQGAYSGSEATFLSFAQDADGDQLIYRWVDGVNHSESIRYDFASNNNELLYHYKNGYSADKPLKKNTVDEDYFYINPYSGTVNFINSDDAGFKRSFVAIDQYHDGQLIGTTINQVPYFSQSKSSPNNSPIINVSSETGVIAQKTTFNYLNDIPSSPNSITPPTHIKPSVIENVTRLRVPYTEVNNNGEVLLEGLDVGENKNVSFDISVSDPNDDTVTLEVLPVDSDLIDTYPWTITDTGNNTYKFEWISPANIGTETALDSKSYMFMLYAKDDNEALPGLPGRTLKPISVTVHKRPSVVITSRDVVNGGTTNDESIHLIISLANIDTSELSDSSYTLTEDSFDLTNASISSLNKIDKSTYSAILSYDQGDPSINPVSTSVKIDEGKFSITKTGGHGINQVSLPNQASNLFTWTSNQIKPKVTFNFFDSKGENLTLNSKTNDPFIVCKVSVSKPVEDFDSADITIVGENISSSGFQKVEGIEETYYTIKISAANDLEGNVDLSISENVFSDALGNQNKEGVLSEDNTAKNFIWEFDRINPILTITNPFAALSTATTEMNGEFIFSFNEPVRFNDKALPDLTSEEIENLVDVLNSNTTNAFFSDFVIDSSYPNQFKLTVNHGGGNKTVTLNVPEDFVQDLYGNNLSDDTISSHPYNLDFPRLHNIYSINKTRSGSSGPYIDSQGEELSYLTNTDPVNILISFLGQAQNESTNRSDIGYQGRDSGDIFNIVNSDITLSSGTLTNLQYFGLGLVDDSGSAEQLFKATYTPNSSFNGFVSFSINADTFSNAIGVSNIFSKKQILLDTNPPSAVFKVFTPQNMPFGKTDITNEDFLLVEARFSEPIDDFTITDLINGNTYSNKFPEISDFIKIDEKTYSFKVTHTTSDGEYSFVDKIVSYADKQGLKNKTQDKFNWYYDTTGPTVGIEVYNGINVIEDLEYSANNIATVKYVFSESGLSLVESGIDLSQLLNVYTENITFTQANFDSENRIITAVGSISSVGEVKIELPQNVFQDRGGNKNASATERIFYYDNSVPEPTISISDGASSISNNSTINSSSVSVSYDFSVGLGTNNYSDFSLSELQEILSSQISNGSLTNLQKVDQDTFEGIISGFNTGEIVVGFPENLVFTDSNVNNIKANNVTFYFDDIAPSATLILSTSDGESVATDAKINQSLVNAKVYVTEPTSDLVIGDFSVLGNVVTSNFQKENDYTYSFDITATSQISSEVSVSLAANSFSDSVGNFNTETIQSSYNFDDVRPVPTISSSLLSDGASTNATIVPVEITFSEDVFFTQSEDRLESYLGSLIENGTISDFTATARTIHFNINRVSNGTTSITLPKNVFNDSHTNGNTEDSFGFTFEGSITLTSVTLDSDNSLEEDYEVSYSTSTSTVSSNIPGTRSLITNGEIDYLYVNNNHTLTLNIVSEAAIIISNVTIDGQTVTAIDTNGNQTNWQAVYSLSSASTEGIIDFQIEFTDTNGVAQTPVTKTTDEVHYMKDFTPPVLSAKILLGDTEVDYLNDPLLEAIHKVVLAADETIYAEKAFTNVDRFQFGGDLAQFAAMMQFLNELYTLNNYHNIEMLNDRPSSTLPMKFSYTNYFNPSKPFFNEQEAYQNGHLILFPKTGEGSYDLTIPDNYFQDLAGNKTSGFSLDGLTLLSSGNSAAVEADIEKKSCENVTKAIVTRRLNYFYDLNYENTSVSVELSDVENFGTYETLGEERIRVLSQARNSKTPNGAIPGFEILTNSYELDIEKSTWIRYKVVDSLSGNNIGRVDEVVTTYSDPVYITINPITTEVLGPVGICGIGETGGFTVNTTGGVWSVSDNTKASINSAGELTSIGSGVIDVIYTTADGCTYLKKLEIFDSPTVAITANGQTTFCEGTSILISSPITDNDKIIWYKNDIPQPQLTANTINLNKPSDSGVYHMGYVTPCGTSISNKIAVKVNELPKASKVRTNE